jgi:hypothetical protein
MATGPATSLFIGNFYLDEEIIKVELWKVLIRDSLSWLSGLMRLGLFQ